MTGFPETADIETASEDYATRFAGEVGRFFLEEQFKRVLKILSQYHNPSLLDVGGGHGQIAIPLVKKGYEVTVTGSAAICENRLKASLPAGSYVYAVCNILDLPYEDNSFDVVLAFRLLPHTCRWQQLIGELCRVARKAVVIDYPDSRSFNILNHLLFRLKKEIEGNTRPFTLFSRKQIRLEYHKHGYDVESFYPEFFLPMVLHRKADSQRFSRASERVFAATGLTSLLGSPVIVHMKNKDRL